MRVDPTLAEAVAARLANARDRYGGAPAAVCRLLAAAGFGVGLLFARLVGDLPFSG